MDVKHPTPETLAAFLTLVEAIQLVRPKFLRYGGEYSPFDAFHALPGACPSCGTPSLYCCFSGPLGGGSSITEEYLHVCTSCRHNDFNEKWYPHDGSEGADCVCLICDFEYAGLHPATGEQRIREFGSRAYAALSTKRLQDLLTRSINSHAADMIREEIESRSAGGNMASSGTGSDQIPNAIAIRERVALRAYGLYEARGCSHGLDLQDWLQAEQEVLAKVGLTKHLVLRHLRHAEWMKWFIESFLADRPERVERSFRRWDDGRGDRGEDVEDFEEKALTLWWDGQWEERRELVLFESGKFAVLQHHHYPHRVYKVDFEADGGGESRTADACPLSDTEFDMWEEGIAENLLALAHETELCDYRYDSLNVADLRDWQEDLLRHPGEDETDVKLLICLMKLVRAISAGARKPEWVIPFASLGPLWDHWRDNAVPHALRPAWYKGVTGTLRSDPWGRAKRVPLVTHDRFGTFRAPTGDGDIVAFRTDGREFVWLIGITFVSEGTGSLFFAVSHGSGGLVYLHGKGKCTMSDGQGIELNTLVDVSDPFPSAEELSVELADHYFTGKCRSCGAISRPSVVLVPIPTDSGRYAISWTCLCGAQAEVEFAYNWVEPWKSRVLRASERAGNFSPELLGGDWYTSHQEPDGSWVGRWETHSYTWWVHEGFAKRK